MTAPTTVALAALPLVLVGVLLVGLLWPATRVMPIAWLSALVVGYTVWEVPPVWLAAATIEGVITALQILFIVFGALVLLYTMLRAGAFDSLNRGFTRISDDRRVQVILLGFFLAAFIEGAAGFGTPAAVVAPLLLGLGFPALAAVIAALVGHVVAVTYGAVGTPIIVGIREPLEAVARTNLSITSEGLTAAEFSVNVAQWAATYHLIAGVGIPFIAVAMIVYFFSDPDERSLAPAIEVAPLCLFAGVAFVVPYWLSAQVSAELPALVGSIVGATIVLVTLQAGYFLPDTEWEFPPRSEWPAHWTGSIERDDVEGALAVDHEMTIRRAWSPYLIVIGLLVLTRMVDPVGALMQGETVSVIGYEFTPHIGAISGTFGTISVGLFGIEWKTILGTELTNGINLFYIPGTWLLVSAIAAIPLFGMSTETAKRAWIEAAGRLATPLVALTFVLAMVQVMLQSGAHDPNVESMIVVLATATADLLGPAYPAVAALIGALGAALVGSNTVSNATFGPFQFVAAENLDLSRELIVGAQAVGGAIGNLVAIHNVVAALATVGLVGQEGRVVRLNLVAVAYYTIVVGVLTMAFVYVVFPETF